MTLGLDPNHVQYTSDGGTWSGSITDEKIRAPILELLEDALRDGVPVSWLPGLSDTRSAKIVSVMIERMDALIEVTMMSSGGPQFLEEGTPTWRITIDFLWA